jgi:predicted AAA+ superfamily ATPase
MPRLLEVLAQHCAETLNLTTIGAQLGMDRKTVDRHAGVLEQLFLVRRVRPWFRNELKRLAKTPKLHFLDSGLATALRRLNVATLGPNRVPLGPLVETFVFGELCKQASWSHDAPEIFHYRDLDGGEIDFILESWDKRIVAIEVKAGATVRPEAFATMRKLAATLGPAFVLGVVLYDGRHLVPMGDRMWAAPLAALWGSRAE